MLYWLEQIIYLLKVLCLEGGKFLSTGTSQCHGLLINVGAHGKEGYLHSTLYSFDF